MIDILAASYIEFGGILEHSLNDQVSDHRNHMIWEPRYQIALGFELPVNKYLTFDAGYRIIDLQYIQGNDGDDKNRQFFVTAKIKPFAR